MPQPKTCDISWMDNRPKVVFTKKFVGWLSDDNDGIEGQNTAFYLQDLYEIYINEIVWGYREDPEVPKVDLIVRM